MFEYITNAFDVLDKCKQSIEHTAQWVKMLRIMKALMAGQIRTNFELGMIPFWSYNFLLKAPRQSHTQGQVIIDD
jgi:hypothetical protein